MAKSSRARTSSGKRPYPQIDWILATDFRHLAARTMAAGYR